MSADQAFSDLIEIEGLGKAAHDEREDVLLRRANRGYVMALVGCLMALGLTSVVFGHGRTGFAIAVLYAPVLAVISLGVRQMRQQENRYTYNPPRSHIQGLGVQVIGGFDHLPASTFARLTDEVQGDLREFLVSKLSPAELEIALALLVDTYDGTVSELMSTAKALAA